MNKNPNVQEYIKNMQALRVVNTTCSTVRGNCRGTKHKKGPVEIENTPLKKRKADHQFNELFYLWMLYIKFHSVMSFFLNAFDFCILFLSCCLYNSRHEDAKANPRMVMYKSANFFKAVSKLH